MDYEELVEIFKPDKYGFCQKHRLWFDTVVKVVGIIQKEEENG